MTTTSVIPAEIKKLLSRPVQAHIERHHLCVSWQGKAVRVHGAGVDITVDPHFAPSLKPQELMYYP